MKKRTSKNEQTKPTTDKSYTGRQKRVVKSNKTTTIDGSGENKRPSSRKPKEEVETGFRQNKRKRNTPPSEGSSEGKKKAREYKRDQDKYSDELKPSANRGAFSKKPFATQSSKSNRKPGFSEPFKKSPFKKSFRKTGEESFERKDNFKGKEISSLKPDSPSKSSWREKRSDTPSKKFQDRKKQENTEKGTGSKRHSHPSKTSSFRNGGKKETPTYKKLNLKSKKSSEEKGSTNEIRLNRYIANAGICSRREADELISSGLIRVNDMVVTEMGFKVKPGDKVKYENRLLKREKLIYVLLNKPKDFITTTDDPEERRTVMDLVKNACDERIYPVGRLDRNTTGLLLLTNDGELADKLSHPSNEIRKVYQVLLDKSLKQEDFEKIKTGVVLEDGPASVDDLSLVTPDATVVGIELHLGRNRIVRRIFEHLGYTVIGLDRVIYAGLTKKDLPRGHWRFLTEKEVIQLKHFS